LKGSKITENLDRRNEILLFIKGKQQKSGNFNKDTDLNILIFTSAFLKGGNSKQVINNFIQEMKKKYNITVTVVQ